MKNSWLMLSINEDFQTDAQITKKTQNSCRLEVGHYVCKLGYKLFFQLVYCRLVIEQLGLPRITKYDGKYKYIFI
jgi:hypothetical protein